MPVWFILLVTPRARDITHITTENIAQARVHTQNARTGTFTKSVSEKLSTFEVKRLTISEDVMAALAALTVNPIAIIAIIIPGMPKALAKTSLRFETFSCVVIISPSFVGFW